MPRKINSFKYIKWDIYEQNKFKKEELFFNHLLINIFGLLFNNVPNQPFKQPFKNILFKQFFKDLPKLLSKDLSILFFGSLSTLFTVNVSKQFFKNIFIKNIIDNKN